MKIGALYQTKELYWFLYPLKKIATRCADTHAASFAAADAADVADYWSNRLKCNVSYIEPNSIFCLLEKDGKLIKVLSTNGELGWINFADWYKDDIEEVNV